MVALSAGNRNSLWRACATSRRESSYGRYQYAGQNRTVVGDTTGRDPGSFVDCYCGADEPTYDRLFSSDGNDLTKLSLEDLMKRTGHQRVSKEPEKIG